MKRRNIKKITQDPNSYGKPEKQFPRVTIRPGKPVDVSNPKINVNATRNFAKTNRKPVEKTLALPIKFTSELPKGNTDVCFVVGGGPSLNGFDFRFCC